MNTGQVLCFIITCVCVHVSVAGYLPCDPNKGDLLAAAVVDQGHADVLQRQDDFLFSQLRLLTLTEQLVDS